MTAAYNAVWYQLLVMGMAVTPLLKRKLAQVILAAACAGKRDRQRLEGVALKALFHQRPVAGNISERVVGATGIEPVTPAMSTQCSYR